MAIHRRMEQTCKIKLASELYLRLKLWHKQSKDFSPDLLVMQKKRNAWQGGFKSQRVYCMSSTRGHGRLSVLVRNSKALWVQASCKRVAKCCSAVKAD